jgi:hypothetical protein
LTTQTLPWAISWCCSGSARTGIELSRRAAQRFADHLNGILNSTVSDSRLSLIALPADPGTFEVTRFVERDSSSLELYGSTIRLFVRYVIVVKDGHCRIESYAYRLQAGESADSWLIRWEYQRDPRTADYPYVRAHVHVRGAFPDGKQAGGLHIPTRRVPLELVLWHLIADWDVKPKRDDWQQQLEASIDGFDGKRLAP